MLECASFLATLTFSNRSLQNSQEEAKEAANSTRLPLNFFGFWRSWLTVTLIGISLAAFANDVAVRIAAAQAMLPRFINQCCDKSFKDAIRICVIRVIRSSEFD